MCRNAADFCVSTFVGYKAVSHCFAVFSSSDSFFAESLLIEDRDKSASSFQFDAFYFFFLPYCSGYIFQYHVEQRW